MKKKLILAALVAVLAPALWLGFGRQDDGPDYAFGMGQKLAGGWLLEANVPDPIEVLVSLSADGGMMMNSTLRPAGANNTGGWLNTRYNTTSHGSWKRTGHNRIEGVTLLLIQDNDGNTVMYEKVMLELTLKAGGTKLEGIGLIHLIEQGNDPLDPNVPVKFAIPVPVATGRPIR